MPRIVDITTGEVCPLCERGFEVGQKCFVQEKAVVHVGDTVYGTLLEVLKDDALIYHEECMNIAINLSIFELAKKAMKIAKTGECRNEKCK